MKKSKCIKHYSYIKHLLNFKTKEYGTNRTCIDKPRRVPHFINSGFLVLNGSGSMETTGRQQQSSRSWKWRLKYFSPLTLVELKNNFLFCWY
jgi:hypothetical protein